MDIMNTLKKTEKPHIAILSAFVLSFLGVCFWKWLRPADPFQYLLLYFYPVFVVFFLYLFERLQDWTTGLWANGVIDGVVLTLSILRAFYPLPLISGHAFFLSYAILTSRRVSVRIAAFLIFLQVAYMKLFLWHDTTLYGGLLCGILASALWLWSNPRHYRIIN